MNIFKAVATYQPSSLGRLLNQLVFVSTANNKFKEFNTSFSANLGNTITFDLPPRMYSNDSLVVNTFDGVEQRQQSLTIDSEANVNFAVTNEEQIFNLDPMDYMEQFGDSAMLELATKIDAQVGQ